MIQSALITVALSLLASLGQVAPVAETAPPRANAAIAVDDWFDCGSDGDCADGEFCRFPRGECGGDGTCTLLPEVCGMDYKPVCGCNGETYSNACDAHSYGVSVDYAGDC